MSFQGEEGAQALQPQHDDGPARPKDNKVDLWCKWKGARWILVKKEDDDKDEIVTIDIPKGNLACHITVRLKAGNKKVVFHPTTPIWAQEGSCPGVEPAGGPIATSQISGVKRVSDDEVCFIDHNEGDPCSVFYALVFSDGSSLDPEIKNGGRG